MIVLRIAIVVLVDAMSREIDDPQETGVHELTKTPVDGGAAHPPLPRLVGKFHDNVVGFEVLMTSKDRLDQVSLLGSDTFAATLEVLLIPLQGRERNLHVTKRKIDSAGRHPRTLDQSTGENNENCRDGTRRTPP
jgi:hypothetical protein